MTMLNDGLVLGLGCESGTGFAELLALAEEALSAAPSGPLRAIVSIDGRAREPALLALARHFQCLFLSFPAARLEAETPRLATPSELVFRHVGCHGVAEAAALAAGGATAQLVVPKQRSRHATAAVAQVDHAQVQKLGLFSSQNESAGSDIELPPFGQTPDLPAVDPPTHRKNPLWPAGHLPHKGGETVGRALGRSEAHDRIAPRYKETAVRHVQGNGGEDRTMGREDATPARPALSPLVGEMPAGRGGVAALAETIDSAGPVS